MPNERQELTHLRADARWCAFQEVASNRVPGSRTIRVFECECGIALRHIEFESGDVGRHGAGTEAGGEAGVTGRGRTDL